MISHQNFDDSALRTSKNKLFEDKYPRYLITLVHGTFAMNAEWIQNESKFTRQLTKELDAPSHVFSFNWSGKNSHSARLQGGSELAAHLTTINTKYPHSENIIIAHSHGGNVALYAIKELKSPEFRFQLITLATPFLNVKERNLSFAMNVAPYFVAIFALNISLFLIPALLFLVIYLFKFLDIIYGRPLDLEVIQYILLALGLFLLVVPLIYKITKKSFEFAKGFASSAHGKAALIQNKIDIKSFEGFPSMSIIMKGDEAGALLGTSSFLSEITFIISDFLKRVGSYLAEKGGALGGVLFIILLLIATLDDVFGYDKDVIGPTILYFVFHVVYAIFYLSFVVLILIYPISLLLKSNPFVFGWESFHHALLIKCHVDTHPYHLKDNYLKIYKTKIGRLKSLVLRHSMVYSDQEIIRDITSWIKSNSTLNPISVIT